MLSSRGIADFTGSCASSGLLCAGYDLPKVRIFEICDNNRFESTYQQAAFEVCVRQAPSFATGYGSQSSAPFWSTLCPQLSHTVTPIKDLMIAFGSIRLRYLTPKSAQREDHKAQPLHQQALQAYQKALREISFQQVVDHEDLGILLACIMLINCTECFLKRVPYDAVHTMSGLRIIRDCTIRPSERQNGTGRSLLDTLVPLFRRAGAAGMAFADDFSDDEFRWQCQGFDLEVPLVFSDVYSLDDRFNAVLKAILISTTDSLCDAQILESVKSALKRLWKLARVQNLVSEPQSSTLLSDSTRYIKERSGSCFILFRALRSRYPLPGRFVAKSLGVDLFTSISTNTSSCFFNYSTTTHRTTL